MLNLTCRIHGADEPRNAVDDLAEIGFDRAQVFLSPPAFGDFLSQALVGSGEFGRPSSDSLIKLGREPLLVAQEPGLSEADRRLIGRHAENQSLRFAGEVRSPGSGHEGAKLS